MYVEGGGGREGVGSADVTFWREVFRRVRPDVAVSIVPRGGKPELEQIARKVALGEAGNTIVAMDLDFDDFLEERIDCPRVIYTWGYSWENDAFRLESLCLSIERASNLGALKEDTLNAIMTLYKDLLARLKRYVWLDFTLRQFGASLFPRLSPGRYISYSNNANPPAVDTSILRRTYLEIAGSVPPGKRQGRVEVSIVDTAACLQGHVLCFLSSKIVSHILRLLGVRIPMSDHFVQQIMIPAFCDSTLTANTPIGQHYRSMLARI